MKKYVFGVDVGGTTVKLGLFDPEGEVKEKWEIPTRKEDNGDHIIADIAESIKEKMSANSIDRMDVVGVGIGVPGPVKEDGTVLLAANLGWGKRNIAMELGELLRVPVMAGNDANVAALGEMWQGGAKSHQNVVMMTLGTGVGGGIILEKVTLFDVYEGKNLETGKKSYAVNFTLQDDQKTMNDKQTDAIMQKIINSLEKQLGAKLR